MQKKEIKTLIFSYLVLRKIKYKRGYVNNNVIEIRIDLQGDVIQDKIIKQKVP